MKKSNAIGYSALYQIEDAENNFSVVKCSSQKGFSLIELLLVLGVFSVLLVAAFVVYPQVGGRRDAQQEERYFNGIVAALIAYRDAAPAGQPLPAPDDLLSAGILPSQAMKEGRWVSAEGKPVVLTEKDGEWVLAYQDISSSFCRGFVPGVALYPELVRGVVVNGKPIGVDSIPALASACDGAKGVEFVLGAGYPDAAVPQPSNTAPTDVKDKRWDTHEAI